MKSIILYEKELDNEIYSIVVDIKVQHSILIISLPKFSDFKIHNNAMDQDAFNMYVDFIISNKILSKITDKNHVYYNAIKEDYVYRKICFLIDEDFKNKHMENIINIIIDLYMYIIETELNKIPLINDSHIGSMIVNTIVDNMKENKKDNHDCRIRINTIST